MRYPNWLLAELKPKASATKEIYALLKDIHVHTVCEEALCPNRGVCYSHKTMTFLILGDICTRDCSFCAIKKGKPTAISGDEIEAILKTVSQLKLKYIVITSVTRDDLKDEGAGQYVKLITALRKNFQNIKIETLTPDYRGNINNAYQIFKARPDVFNHNIETVERLYPLLRSKADYHHSLSLLRIAKQQQLITKSGIMVGVGESKKDVFDLLHDLHDTGVDIVTIGQYLSASKNNYPVKRFVTPDEFEEYKHYGEAIGIKYIFSAPLVRSSYMAETVIKELVAKQ